VIYCDEFVSVTDDLAQVTGKVNILMPFYLERLENEL
jgi:hypothetical protein